MEDPESEWEIQEYPPSKSEEGETTTVRWILNKGYGIGKTVVITGIAISSAPLVLPPLVVFSAIGVAFSVPFGLVYASYACTNTIMSKLLPTPSSSFMEEHEDEAEEEEWEDDEFRREYMIQEEEKEQLEDMKREVEMRLTLDDDYRQKDEGSITNFDESVDVRGYYTDEDEDKNEEENDEFYRENEWQQKEKEQMEKMMEQGHEEDEDSYEYKQIEVILNDNVDEKGYEEDVGEFIEGDDDITEERNEEEPLAVVSLVVENEEINQNRGNDEKVIEPEEEIARGSTGLLEKMRDEEKINDIVKDDSLGVNEPRDVSNDDDIKMTTPIIVRKVDSSHLVNSGIKKINDIVKDDSLGVNEPRDVSNDDDIKMTKRIIVRKIDSIQLVNSGIKNDEEPMSNVNEDKDKGMVRGNTGLIAEIRDEREMDNAVEDDFLGVNNSNRVSNGEDVKMTKMNIVKEVDSEKLVKLGSKNEEEPVGEMRRVVLVGGNEENNFNLREVEELDLVARGVKQETWNEEKEKDDEQIMKESMGFLENVEVSTANDEHDSDVERKKQRLIESNDDVREIADESGLDLFDDRNAADYQNTNMNFESIEGNDEVKENIGDDSVDVLALPGFRRVIVDLEDAEVDSKTDKKVPSREAFTKEKKIWEQIGAMRAIVGYKAASQSTCIGEVKALYVFIGVEPPPSFQDDSNLDEVYDMLKFLMSIVGVK